MAATPRHSRHVGPAVTLRAPRPNSAARRARASSAVYEPLEGRRLLAVTPVTPGVVWGTLDANPASVVDVNGTTFFTAVSPAGAGLYRTDGTAGGTALVRSFGTDQNFVPTRLTASGNTLYFLATDAQHGNELWKSDGTPAGTVLVKDVRPGASSSSTSNLTPVNGTLFFTANDGVAGAELWKTDGTEAGTVRVADINPGAGSSATNDDDFTAMGGAVYFRASAGALGNAVYRSDGTTAGTARISGYLTGGRRPGEMAAVGNTLFYSFNDELWTTDGTAANAAR